MAKLLQIPEFSRKTIRYTDLHMQHIKYNTKSRFPYNFRSIFFTSHDRFVRTSKAEFINGVRPRGGHGAVTRHDDAF